MARSWPQSSNQARNSGATVLSAVTNEERAKSQLAMAELLGLENLPVCLLPELSPETSSALTEYPDQRFAFLVLGLDVAWGPLLDASSDLLAAEQHLGRLLGLGSTIFIEVLQQFFVVRLRSQLTRNRQQVQQSLVVLISLFS